MYNESDHFGPLVHFEGCEEGQALFRAPGRCFLMKSWAHRRFRGNWAYRYDKSDPFPFSHASASVASELSWGRLLARFHYRSEPLTRYFVHGAILRCEPLVRSNMGSMECSKHTEAVQLVSSADRQHSGQHYDSWGYSYAGKIDCDSLVLGPNIKDGVGADLLELDTWSEGLGIYSRLKRVLAQASGFVDKASSDMFRLLRN